MTKPTEQEQLQALKNKADMLGLTYHPSIGLEKLQEKIKAKMEEQPSEDPVDAGKVENSGESDAVVQAREAGRLIRVIVNTRDKNKQDWPGEIVSAGNSKVGFFKKYIPYGTEWHVPKIILNTLRSKKTQIFNTVIDSKGNKTKVPKLIGAYTIEELEPLTPKELQDLAKAQQGSGRIED